MPIDYLLEKRKNAFPVPFVSMIIKLRAGNCLPCIVIAACSAVEELAVDSGASTDSLDGVIVNTSSNMLCKKPDTHLSSC